MVIEEDISRGAIYLVYLNPTRGSEIRKTRPYAVISPDEPNARLMQHPANMQSHLCWLPAPDHAAA
ncbi:MAG: type II toxin-antitoxin system PemK/MazF family toxin [Synechococcus sp.]|nr:type II toxin-antitoxin system PemK/MazF family toxin [Synechococcus sp.]